MMSLNPLPAAPLTKAQIAELFHVTTKTITRWCDEGKLPFIKMGREKQSRVYFQWGTVTAHLQQHFGKCN